MGLWRRTFCSAAATLATIPPSSYTLTGGAGGALEAHTGEAIGNSGICEGGLAAAMDACDDALVDPDDFKFFFNYVQFTDNEIEGMLAEEDSAGDAWASVEVPSSFILGLRLCPGRGLDVPEESAQGGV